ncbi:hypothetical protein BGZ47_005534 [Haplosporangium gracile]|nr:hypothetical protein BGZ47_005534 [Haplosporangium gracile]
MADNNHQTDTRPSAERHPTSEPFTDPNPNKEGIRQHAAKVIALPLAAAGGVVAEVSRKVKELVTGESTEIDTSHSDEPK